MKPYLPSILGGSLLLLSGTGHAAISMPAVGVYDSTNNANTVDRYANGDATSYGTFVAAVASAFAAGNGGVVNFDSNLINSQSSITTTYASGAKTLNISTNVDVNAQTSANITGISGTNTNSVNDQPTGGFFLQSSAGQSTIFTIGAIDGGAPGEYVSQIGFTLLSRINGGGTPAITATAMFSDGSSANASSSFTQTATGEDTFFSFAAPAGRSITSLTLDYGGTADLRRGLDDLAFITAVPEPSAMLLGALGLLPFLRRRR